VLDRDASCAVIKDAVTACGVECVRADEILHPVSIDKPIYEQLLGADLVIADLCTDAVLIVTLTLRSDHSPVRLWTRWCAGGRPRRSR